MNFYILSLGSNAADADIKLAQTRTLLGKIAQCIWSDCYTFPERNKLPVPNYINQCGFIYSKLNQNQLKQSLHQIEQKLGRARPTTESLLQIVNIDIDIIADGCGLQKLRFNPKKLPLPDDVKIPLVNLIRKATSMLPPL